MFRVYISIGSNLLKPLHQTFNALGALRNLPQSKMITYSSFYRSKPMGPQDQPDFLNAAVALDTLLLPETLLYYTQSIERAQSISPKNERWGPRALDLDIMLYENKIINTKDLTIPHYGLKEREFMLYPLYEIAPDIFFPDGETLTKCLKNVPKNSMTLWQE